MEPEVSFLRLQDPATGSNQSRMNPPYLFEAYFRIVIYA